MKHVLSTEKAPAAIGPYSQGIHAAGLTFVSGQLPVDPATGVMPEEAGEQAKQSLTNVAAILESNGCTMDDIVKTTVFLVDMNDFAAVNEVYKTFFPGSFPARSCVAVKELPKGAKVEIEAIAFAGGLDL